MEEASSRGVVAAAWGSVTFAPAVPDQVEAPPAVFVDRERQLAALRACATGTGRSRPGVVTVHGLQGVGKTALLRQFAAANGNLFADGVMSVTFTPQERAPGEAVARLLLGLGVPEHALPATPERRFDLWRTMSAKLSLLVLLDDVTDANQVSALLPKSPRSMVVAAGNRLLEDVEDAIDLRLPPLSVEDGVRLLGEICGAERVEPAAARELVEGYEGLPLAIGVAGRRLAGRPDWSMDMLLDELREVGAGPVTTKVFGMFDHVYADLSPSAARLYRVLGVVVGVRFGFEVLAAMTERAPRALRADLDELVATGLVEVEGLNAYRLHRLVRQHALHWAASEESTEDRRGLRRRAVLWWLFGAMTADLAADPDRLRVPDPASVRVERAAGISPAAGLDWLDREHANLLEVLAAAAEEGWHAEVCRLFEALFALYKTRKPLSAWVRAGRMAVDSAVATGDSPTEARCRCLLAKAFQELLRYDEAAEQLVAARALVADGPERFAASTFDFTGNLCLRRGDASVALEWFLRALDINRRLGLVRGTALQSTLAARALSALGRFDEALELLATARDLVTGSPAEPLLPKILATTGAVLDAAGRPAEPTLLAAVSRAETLGNTADAVDALITLANLGGDHAEEYRDRAVVLLEGMGSPLAARVLVGRG